MKVILALDLSSSATGWFLTADNCGIISIDKKLDFPAKLSFIRSEVSRILESSKPELVIIEDTYLRFQNVATLKQLARVSGVIMEICSSSGIPIKTVTATQARKHCCGKNDKAPSKQEVFNFFVEKKGFNSICQRLWGRDCNFDMDNDLTDAAAVHYGYRVIFDLEKGEIADAN